MKNRKIFLFIGPTAFGLEIETLITPGTVVMPPVRRGDIQVLIAREEPSIILMVDGTYHAYPAVSHVEIKNALECGWQVWGMGSMGAIRAAEMHELGMKGYGEVFQRYRDEEDLPDDFVALVHGSEPPWYPVSEPLIHLEALLKAAMYAEIITQDINRRIMANLQNMWFGYRTLRYMKEITCMFLKGNNQQFCNLINQMSSYRIKSIDVSNFFQEKPFLHERR